MKQGSEKLIVAAALAVFLIVAGAMVLPAFIRARTTSSQNACINNLRQIDGAKQQWALEKSKTANDIPSWADVQPYLGRGPQGEIPRCPQGGTYILGKVGELPRCSIGGPNHSLPPQ
ncbi:MAG: prepilin-type cleavage/methylation domain-containing protein [Limisphaerales bacterium]